MLNSEQLSNIDKKGYTIIKGFFNEKKLNSWKNFWREREVLAAEYAFKNSQDIKQRTSLIQIDLDGNIQKYIKRIQHILIETTKGKTFIEETTKLIQQINPKAKYLKDRYIAQKAKSLTHCSLPHQDTTTYCTEELGSQVYTIYISLTDTDENTGTLFIEDIEEKRTESLGMCELGCFNGFACICASEAMALNPEQIKNYTGQNKIKSQHKLIPTFLAAGDCIIFDGFVLHGTATNMGDHDRKTMTMTYMIPHDPSEDLITQHYKYRTGKLPRSPEIEENRRDRPPGPWRPLENPAPDFSKS